VGRVGRAERPKWEDLSHAKWQKSTRSGANGCVEIAFLNSSVAVRDSKDQHLDDHQKPVLLFDPVEWDQFISRVRDGEFDLPSHFL
jgi:hypothetical protein